MLEVIETYAPAVDDVLHIFEFLLVLLLYFYYRNSENI
jgi:hypothetical protein